MSEWNDIVLTKPGDMELVLVSDQFGELALGRRPKDGPWIGLESNAAFSRVRYWMRLPEIPE